MIDRNRIPTAVLAVLVGLGVGAGLGKLLFGGDNSDDGEDRGAVGDDLDEPVATEDSSPEGTATETPPGGTAESVDPLDVARAYLQAGKTTAAVRTGYGAVRTAIHRRTGGSLETDARTHREFYSDVRAELTDGDGDSLELLTDVYERAVFAPTGVDEATAETAVTAAERCLRDHDGRGHAASDGGRDEPG